MRVHILNCLHPAACRLPAQCTRTLVHCPLHMDPFTRPLAHGPLHTDPCTQTLASPSLLAPLGSYVRIGSDFRILAFDAARCCCVLAIIRHFCIWGNFVSCFFP